MERVNLPGMVGFYKKDISGNSKYGRTELASAEEHNGEDISDVIVGTADQGSDGEEKEDIEEEGSGCGHGTEEGGCGSDVMDSVVEGGSGRDDISDDEDEDGWITPNNLAQACEEMGGVTEEEARGLAVACVTTDFAMQASV